MHQYISFQQQLKSLNPNYINESKERFFYENDFESNQFSKNSSNESTHIARSILIDMENKVVNKLLNKPSDLNFNWKYSQHNSYTRKKGSGNNWSYGYCINGPKSEEKIMEIIRREVEKADRLSAFLVCGSLAGGKLLVLISYYFLILLFF